MMMIVAVTLTAIVFVKMYKSKLDVVGCYIPVTDICFFLNVKHWLMHAPSKQGSSFLSLYNIQCYGPNSWHCTTVQSKRR